MNPRLFEILIGSRQALHRLTGFVFLALVCNSSVQIKHVEFPARMSQQMSDVPESPCVLQRNGVRGVSDGPISALFAEDRFLWRTEARPQTVGSRRDELSAWHITCHLPSL